MAADLLEQLRAEMAAWEAAGLRRELLAPAGADFTSNDYLGLSREPRLIAAARAALEEYGVGAPAARLLRGHLPPHAAAERAAAEWLGTEGALLFPTGWQANQALLATIAGRGDLLACDELNHASLIDGARLSRARIEVFPHGDAAALARVLHAHSGARRRFIVCESVYSMDGDLAPLADFHELARAHDAWLLVDEAHAAGMYGPQGAGKVSALAASERVFARVFTGGKALGASGGFVAGGAPLIETLVNRGRAFVYTTAPAPATAAALVQAIAIARAEPGRRIRAHAAAARLRAGLAAAGVPAGGESAIVPIRLGSERRTLAAAAVLQERGFDVRAVRPPTVPAGTSRLRLVCHADHADQDIDALVAGVVDAMERVGRNSPAVVAARARPLVVAGTDTGVGKTLLAALLARAARRAGKDVRYTKLVQTGADSDTGTVRTLAQLDATHAEAPLAAFALAASVDQAAAAEGRGITVEALFAAVRARLDTTPAAAWILECAGGLRVPLNAREDQLDLLARLGAPLVLVARSGLGTLNHTLLSVEAARSRGLRVAAVVLNGPLHADNLATLRARCDFPVLAMPQLRDLGAAALDSALDAEALAELLP
ncbi:MAG TPA: dethiobiotin synthase [Planctomycetota bacterium]